MARANDSDDAGGCLAIFFGLLALGLVILAVAWFFSFVGHALALTPTYPEIDRHGHAWIDAHYEHVAGGYVLTVLTLLVGLPLSVALTAELASPRPRARIALALAAPLVALVAAVAFAPVGAH